MATSNGGTAVTGPSVPAPELPDFVQVPDPEDIQETSPKPQPTPPVPVEIGASAEVNWPQSKPISSSSSSSSSDEDFTSDFDSDDAVPEPEDFSENPESCDEEDHDDLDDPETEAPQLMFRVNLAVELGGGYCTLRTHQDVQVSELRDALLDKLAPKNKYIGSVGRKGVVEKLYFSHQPSSAALDTFPRNSERREIPASEPVTVLEAFGDGLSEPQASGEEISLTRRNRGTITLTLGYAEPQEDCSFSYDAFTTQYPEVPCIYVHVHECTGLLSKDRSTLSDPMVFLEVASPESKTSSGKDFLNTSTLTQSQHITTTMYRTLDPKYNEEAILSLECVDHTSTTAAAGSPNPSSDPSSDSSSSQEPVIRIQKQPLCVWVWNRHHAGSPGSFLGHVSIPWWEYMASELISRRFSLQPGPGKFAKIPIAGSLLLSFQYHLPSFGSYTVSGSPGSEGAAHSSASTDPSPGADSSEEASAAPLQVFYGNHVRKDIMSYRTALNSPLLQTPSTPGSGQSSLLPLMYLLVRWEHSQDLVRAILQSCDPNSRQGRLTLESVFLIFQHHTFRSTVAMIADTVAHEIATTKYLSELFRVNSPATFLLSRFVRATASDFCRKLLGPVLGSQILKKRRMNLLQPLSSLIAGDPNSSGESGGDQGSFGGSGSSSSSSSPCEIDPLRVLTAQNLNRNALRLREHCDLVLQVILNSLPGMGEEGSFLEDSKSFDLSSGNLLTGLVGGMKKKKKRITVPQTVSYLAFHLEAAVKRGIRLRKRYLEQRFRANQTEAQQQRALPKSESESLRRRANNRRQSSTSGKRRFQELQDGENPSGSPAGESSWGSRNASVDSQNFSLGTMEIAEDLPQEQKQQRPTPASEAGNPAEIASAPEQFQDPDPKFNLPNVLQLTLVSSLFLRFICPAIVSPQSYGILPPDTILSVGSRRTLVLIAKVIQSAANTQGMADLFRKEQYMSCMHEYMDLMSPKITAYLFGLAAGYKRQAREQHRQELTEAFQAQHSQAFPSVALPSFEHSEVDQEANRVAMVRLVHYIYEHRDNISEKIDLLQSQFNPPADETPSSSPSLRPIPSDSQIPEILISSTEEAEKEAKEKESLDSEHSGTSLDDPDMIELTGLSNSSQLGFLDSSPDDSSPLLPSGLSSESMVPDPDPAPPGQDARETPEQGKQPNVDLPDPPGATVSSQTSSEAPGSEVSDAIAPRELFHRYLALVEQSNIHLTSL